MLTLLATVAVIVCCYFLQQGSPFLAGLLAVVPVKIIGTAAMSFEGGGIERLSTALEGMLIGQFAWGAVLLVVYLWIRQ